MIFRGGLLTLCGSCGGTSQLQQPSQV